MSDSFWWLSFCDPELPAGNRFLGACIVPGLDMVSAIQKAHSLGCNPGGEVSGMEILSPFHKHLVPFAGELMDREKCKFVESKLTAAVNSDDN